MMFTSSEYYFKMPEIRRMATRVLCDADNMATLTQDQDGVDHRDVTIGKINKMGKEELRKLLNERIIGLNIPDSAGKPSLSEIDDVDSSLVPDWAWDCIESKWMSNPQCVSSGRSYQSSSIQGLVEPKKDPVTGAKLIGAPIDNWNLKMAIQYWLFEQTGFTIEEINATRLIGITELIGETIKLYRDLSISTDTFDVDPLSAPLILSDEGKFQLSNNLQFLVEAEKIIPRDLGLKKLIGIGYEQLGQFKEAYRAYREGANLNKDDCTLTVRGARVYLREDKNDETATNQVIVSLNTHLKKMTSKMHSESLERSAQLALEARVAICTYLRGLLFVRNKRIDSAISDFNEALRWKSSLLCAHLALAECYDSKDDSLSQLYYLDHLLTNVTTIQDQSGTTHNSCNYDPAIVRNVQFWRCRVLFSLAMYRQVVEQCDKLLLSMPMGTASDTLINMHYLLAQSHFKLGAMSDALTHYIEVTKMDPTNPCAWFRMGEISYKTGDKHAALDHFTKAIELEEKKYKLGSTELAASTSRINRAILYREFGRLDNAREDYEMFFKRQDKSHRADRTGRSGGSKDGFAEEKLALGTIYFLQGNYKSALSQLENIKKPSLECERMIAVCQSKLDDDDLDAEELSTLIGSFPKDSELLTCRAKLFVKKKLYIHALHDLDNSLTDNKERDEDVYTLRSSVLSHLERYEDAINDLLLCRSNDGHDVIHLCGKAVEEMRKGGKEGWRVQAIDLLTRAFAKHEQLGSLVGMRQSLLDETDVQK